MKLTDYLYNTFIFIYTYIYIYIYIYIYVCNDGKEANTVRRLISVLFSYLSCHVVSNLYQIYTCVHDRIAIVKACTEQIKARSSTHKRALLNN